MNTSSSMRKLPSRNEFPSRKEFTVLPKDAGLPEESESPTPVQNNVKDGDPQDESWSRLQVVGAVLKYSIQFGVTVTVLYFQIKNRPLDVYDTDGPWDTSRGGESYTCGCASLGLGADHEDLTANTSLNICYNKSSILETVTVLMYSNSSAETIERILDKIEPDKSDEISRLTMPGYKVTLDAYELYGSITNSDPVAAGLQPLFIEGHQQPYTYPALGDLLSPSFLCFPMTSYVRLYFEYYCNSCAVCRPDVVNDIWDGISNRDGWWASCSRREPEQMQANSSAHTCQVDDAYYGKCLMYPSDTLPPSIAVSEFFNKILDLPGINGSLDVWKGGERWENHTALQPSHLFLTISQVQKSSIQLNFVEVIRNSALWAWLLTVFPTMDNECAAVDNVDVCEGTSVCNVFTNKNDLRCFDMDKRTACEQLMTANGTGQSTIDNTGRSNLWSRLTATSWLELECPEFKCESKKVPPYLVMRNTSSEMENDTLNRFLSRSMLEDSWAQRSGVCTTTYRDVYRHREHNRTMFLETMCTTMSTSWEYPDGYCWLTGRYHYINDNPTDDWKFIRTDDPLFVKSHKLFRCNKVKREGFGSWLIATMGILFGWIGTVDLISRWLAKRIQPWIRKKRKLMTSPKN